MEQSTEGHTKEIEMRDSKVPWFGTLEDLTKYIEDLVDREHDYGTCVYATSMAATATFQFMAGQLGITGFQASCAGMDILSRTRGFKWGKLLNYDDLLYPQYWNEEHFPSLATLLDDNRVELGKRAQELIDKNKDRVVSEVVMNHWKSLITASGIDSEKNEECHRSKD